MYTALIATRFIGTGTPGVDPFRPAVADSYAVDWEDVVGIPSARLGGLVKNVNIIKVAVPDATVATLNAAGADANYVVLWQERTDDTDGHVVSGNRQTTLTAGQLSAIKSWLVARNYVAADLAGVTLPITREDAATALIALFRNAT